MIQLPENFDVAALFSDFTEAAEPFVIIALGFAVYLLIITAIRKSI